MNAAVVDWIKANVLSEQLVDATIREVERRLRERTATSGSELKALEAEVTQLRAEIGRLAEALATNTTKADDLRPLGRRGRRAAGHGTCRARGFRRRDGRSM